MECWSLAWRILSITLIVWKMSAIVQWFEHSLALPFFGIGIKTDLSQSLGHHWVFQICWNTECSTFTLSSFRIWNSSNGIPSPPLALFVVMLPKAHLTSHSRMSGSRWVITSLWLSESWRSFLYSSSVYPCHLFLISSASVFASAKLEFLFIKWRSKALTSRLQIHFSVYNLFTYQKHLIQLIPCSLCKPFLSLSTF